MYWKNSHRGGKVAMTLALRQFPAVQSLIVVDMAPVNVGLSVDFATFVEAMKVVDAAGCTKQSMADEILRESVPDIANRHFLLTNLKRDSHTGIYRFRIPLDTLGDSLTNMGAFPFDVAHHTYHGRTLIIAGANSGYVRPEKNAQTIRTFFPQSRVVVIDDAGHWGESFVTVWGEGTTLFEIRVDDK
ncbi:hypothetical protein BC936DRAFT_139044 [Jimgerdemannia flammicorona]|uniref:Alpha/Beta hydrolase protein n=1 Tax=Jimgerdemannia flammicorona TaxID=994334 RepID=A0A433BAT0_9FUNG|nr:hypothetical protein BC936DRAFT_139044 [Jimgerdemannia flammicorona]